MVRAGRRGEQEDVAIEQGVVTIGWNELPDLSNIRTKKELERVYLQTYPTAKKMQVANEVGQIWRFIREIRKGDLVALPLKKRSVIAIGEVIGDYEYKILSENVKHIRKVKWLKEISRTALDQDLLYSLGAFMTVCQIKRNRAEERIRRLLIQGLEGKIPDEGKKVFEEIIDIEDYAKDRIIEYIKRKFKGHELARLVEAILKAQGYVTERSQPGPDSGVDILASAGPLGFDPPRICVQVKSLTFPVGVEILDRLAGVMKKVDADQGLLVSWGGFTRDALKEARNKFFTIRLWDANDLLEAIFKHYEKFDDELKTELPLKRIWVLVLEAESS
jgi:restriction system protein